MTERAEERYAVTRVSRSAGENNRFVIDRTETWHFARIADFSSREEAEAYIRDATKCTPEFIARAVDLDEIARNEFLQAFCFNDERYMAYRSYFLGPPPLEDIARALRADGVDVDA